MINQNQIRFDDAKTFRLRAPALSRL